MAARSGFVQPSGNEGPTVTKITPTPALVSRLSTPDRSVSRSVGQSVTIHFVDRLGRKISELATAANIADPLVQYLVSYGACDVQIAVKVVQEALSAMSTGRL